MDSQRLSHRIERTAHAHNGLSLGKDMPMIAALLLAVAFGSWGCETKDDQLSRLRQEAQKKFHEQTYVSLIDTDGAKIKTPR